LARPSTSRQPRSMASNGHDGDLGRGILRLQPVQLPLWICERGHASRWRLAAADQALHVSESRLPDQEPRRVELSRRRPNPGSYSR
jgi:hypothetical protein